MARYCTIPEIFGLRSWFETRFSDLCKQHDAVYVQRKFGEIGRLVADLQFCMGMWGKGYRALAVLSFYVIWIAGWVLWHNVTENKLWQNILMATSHAGILVALCLWIF